MATENLNFKVEYLWIDLAQQTYTWPAVSNPPAVNLPQVNIPLGRQGSTIKVGANWLFH